MYYKKIAYSVLRNNGVGLDLGDSDFLNSRRAIDIITGEELGAIEFIDHGDVFRLSDIYII